jgi:hypothetical protein
MLIRTLTLFVSTCLAGTTLFAADASFVGKWKLNLDKSKITGVQRSIEDLGGDKFKFTFGDDTETIAIDGKEYPAKIGGTWSIKKEGPNSWKSVRSRDGKVVSTAIWTVSEDGKTLTQTTEGTRVDGSTFKTVLKSKRIAGTSGLAGTWESTDVNTNSVVPFEIAAYEGDGLSFISSAGQRRLDLKFDGKDYPDKGPRVTEGATASGKRIDQRAIEVSNKVKGKLLNTERMEVSADGKTLTTTTSFPGVAKSQTFVYERQ